LPVDVLSDEAEMGEIAASDGIFARVAPDPDGIAAAAAALAAARQVTLVLGDGVHKSGAVAEAIALAELLGARVYSVAGYGVIFPTTHPQDLGGLNPAQSGVQAALRASDVVLVVGANPYNPQRFGLAPAFASTSTLVQIDASPAEVAKNLPVDIG